MEEGQIDIQALASEVQACYFPTLYCDNNGEPISEHSFLDLMVGVKCTYTSRGGRKPCSRYCVKE